MYIAERKGWHQTLRFPLTPQAPQGTFNGQQLLMTSQLFWLASADLTARDGELQALGVMFANYFGHF